MLLRIQKGSTLRVKTPYFDSNSPTYHHTHLYCNSCQYQNQLLYCLVSSATNVSAARETSKYCQHLWLTTTCHVDLDATTLNSPRCISASTPNGLEESHLPSKRQWSDNNFFCFIIFWRHVQHSTFIERCTRRHQHRGFWNRHCVVIYTGKTYQ